MPTSAKLSMPSRNGKTHPMPSLPCVVSPMFGFSERMRQLTRSFLASMLIFGHLLYTMAFDLTYFATCHVNKSQFEQKLEPLITILRSSAVINPISAVCTNIPRHSFVVKPARSSDYNPPQISTRTFFFSRDVQHAVINTGAMMTEQTDYRRWLWWQLPVTIKVTIPPKEDQVIAKGV